MKYTLTKLSNPTWTGGNFTIEELKDILYKHICIESKTDIDKDFTIDQLLATECGINFKVSEVN